MARIAPLRPEERSPNTITSVNLTPELLEQIDAEKRRVGARNRSELIRLVLEEYFKQEL